MCKYFLTACLALGMVIPSAQSAQFNVPVVESPAEVPVDRPSSGPATDNRSSQNTMSQPGFSSPDANFRRGNLADLLYQIETLQQEVQTLRGMVEEQGYTIQQMRAEQRDRYLDLDRRISLFNLSDTPAEQTAPAVATDTRTTAPNISATGVVEPGINPQEKNDFDAAFNLIRSKQYENATRAFNKFTQDYPGGTYTANAYYWLGEVETVQANFKEALTAFEQLIEQYPQHRKIPDAKYKQGKIYRRLGDTAKATQVLESVVSQHPGTSAAKLAESELQNLKSSS